MIKKLVAVAALALITSSAFAATPNSYYGGFDSGATKVDDSDRASSFGGFLGYNFQEHFAAEFSVRHLGKWNDDGLEIKVAQTAISVVGTLPLQSNFNVFARIGYNRLSGDVSYQGRSASASINRGMYGVGVGYNLTETIVGRLEFQKPASDTQNISIALAFQF